MNKNKKVVDKESVGEGILKLMKYIVQYYFLAIISLLIYGGFTLGKSLNYDNPMNVWVWISVLIILISIFVYGFIKFKFANFFMWSGTILLIFITAGQFDFMQWSSSLFGFGLLIEILSQFGINFEWDKKNMELIISWGNRK